MLIRFTIVLIIVALAIVGYGYIKDILLEKRVEEYSRYAGVVAETSIAAELYRDNQDSFFVVRDSILNKYGLTVAEVQDFKERYKGDEYRWAEFWSYVMNISDSLIAHQESLLMLPADTSLKR